MNLLQLCPTPILKKGNTVVLEQSCCAYGGFLSSYSTAFGHKSVEDVQKKPPVRFGYFHTGDRLLASNDTNIGICLGDSNTKVKGFRTVFHDFGLF